MQTYIRQNKDFQINSEDFYHHVLLNCMYHELYTLHFLMIKTISHIARAY